MTGNRRGAEMHATNHTGAHQARDGRPVECLVRPHGHPVGLPGRLLGLTGHLAGPQEHEGPAREDARQPGRDGGSPGPYGGPLRLPATVSGMRVSPLLPAGTRIAGRYRLVDRVGGPDLAPVWKGADEVLARPVTVWLLGPGPVPGALVEAVRTTGRLTDPRVARIFDADYRADHPYVVSEWAPGEPLDSLLTHRGLPGPALAARIATQAAFALAAAHAAGQPHLHLGPQSVRLNASGVKITGLGIEAALLGAADGADPAWAARADTRALAGILYALLTGYWPGEEATALPPAPRLRGRVYSPRQVRAGVPATLSAITSRALSDLSPRQPPIATPGAFARALRETRLPGELEVTAAPGVLPAARAGWRPRRVPAA